MEYSGGCSSAIFMKDVKNMMPFTPYSVWNFSSYQGAKKHSMNPVTTSTSVLGIAFDKGVMICADTLGCYGSLARYFNCPRVLKVNKQTVLGVGGDIADFQYLTSLIEQHVIDEECLNDGFYLKPRALHCLLTRTMYNRRSKFDPLWNSIVVGGMQDGVPYLGTVDKIGTAYETPTIATGYGSYLAQPILRTASEKNRNMTQQEAQKLLVDCIRVLYYRDARAHYKYTLAVVTDEGVEVKGPIEIDTDFSAALHIKEE